MTHISRLGIALLIGAAIAAPCWGQAGIPLRPLPPIPVSPLWPPPYVPPYVPGYPITPGSSGRESSIRSAAYDNDDQGGYRVMIGLVVIFSILGGAGSLVIVRCVRMSRTVAHLRIIGTPPGEAPEEIRRAWVGVELPLRRSETVPGTHLTEGVLSRGDLVSAAGYAVDGRAAVKALASHAPEAAAWWRKYAPHVLSRGYRFLFPCEVCERAGGDWGTEQAMGQESVPAKDTLKWWHTSEFGLGADGRQGVWRRQVPPWEN
jgi:hypothetical protein